MTDLKWFNRETADERKARHERAELATSGARGFDGLTDTERLLLMRLQASTQDIQLIRRAQRRDGVR